MIHLPAFLRSFTVALCLLYGISAAAQTFPEPVHTIKLSDTLLLKIGNIAQGHFIPEEFMTISFKSCFTPAHAPLYTGKHVFYGFQMPENTEVNLTLISKSHVSLYAFQLPANDFSSFPPNIASGICRSSSSQPDSTTGEWSIDLKTLNKKNNVIIGIAGANKLELANFVLRIHSRFEVPEEIIEKPKSVKAYRLKIAGTEELSYQGSFENAALIPVQWASQAPANCMSFDELDRLKKEHIYYLLKIPAGQTLNLDFLPSDQQASVGAWVITGHDGASLPPNLQKSELCTVYESEIPGGSCAFSVPNYSKSETNVLIGLFVDKFKDPNFTLKLKLSN